MCEHVYGYCSCVHFCAAGRTPAWVAARKLSNPATLRIFAEQGANLQYQHPRQGSLLHAAVLNECLDTVGVYHPGVTGLYSRKWILVYSSESSTEERALGS